ncbi:MAG TPA: glycosyltransferase family 2 protein [Verrucomicrobiae bacterium]|jgi:glycosyltransferase involved in cell wall biosynthesis
MQPLVSVLITVFNRERYLAAAVDSVLSQTMQDFEIIIVDDCSSDASTEIAKSFAIRDSRIHFFRNEHNLGDYPNRNRAASFATGKYLKYVDADDLIYPHALAVKVAAMEKWPAAGLGISWNVMDPPQPYPFISTPREIIRGHFLARSVLGAGPTAAIINRESFAAAGQFSGRQFIGDTELWLRLAQAQPVVSLPPSLVWWRRHEGQQMNFEQACPDVIAQRYQLEIETLDATTLLGAAEKRQALARLRQRHGRRLLSMGLRNRKIQVAGKLWKQSNLNWSDFFHAFRGYQ